MQAGSPNSIGEVIRFLKDIERFGRTHIRTRSATALERSTRDEPRDTGAQRRTRNANLFAQHALGRQAIAAGKLMVLDIPKNPLNSTIFGGIA